MANILLTTRMAWRSLRLDIGTATLHLGIEPFVEGPDRVLVPGAAAWERADRTLTPALRAEVLRQIRGADWNRDLIWQDAHWADLVDDTTLRAGSVEATPAGQAMLAEDPFSSGTVIDREMVRHAFLTLETRYAEAASGRAAIWVDRLEPGSVMFEVSLRTLQKNPHAEPVIIMDLPEGPLEIALGPETDLDLLARATAIDFTRPRRSIFFSGARARDGAERLCFEGWHDGQRTLNAFIWEQDPGLLDSIDGVAPEAFARTEAIWTFLSARWAQSAR